MTKEVAQHPQAMHRHPVVLHPRVTVHHQRRRHHRRPEEDITPHFQQAL
jgi:hypothetical protein